MKKSRRGIPKARRASPEHDLQKAVAKMMPLWLRSPTYWTAIDHAAKLSPRYGAQRKARGVQRGIGDFLVMHPRGSETVVLFIELKAQKGLISPSQKEFAQACLAANARHRICRSLEEIETAFWDCGITIHATVGAV